MEVKERKSPRTLISRSTGTGGGSFVFVFFNQRLQDEKQCSFTNFELLGKKSDYNT